MAEHRKMNTIDGIKFCGYCGSSLYLGADDSRRMICSGCKHVAYHGPKLLVVLHLFAESRQLLVKRGIPPYVGSWAPPGGFVEANESLEDAALRETEEEVGIRLDNVELVPVGNWSLPSINQVYSTFLAVLDRVVTPIPSLPECIDARWFTLDEYPQADIWAPAADIEIRQLFEQVRTRTFRFYQNSGKKLTVFGA